MLAAKRAGIDPALAAGRPVPFRVVAGISATELETSATDAVSSPAESSSHTSA